MAALKVEKKVERSVAWMVGNWEYLRVADLVVLKVDMKAGVLEC